MYKILIVDDDVDLLEITALILKMNNFKVEAIGNWEKIQLSISVFKPDLILLDVSLDGDADGRIICRQIKTADATKHIAVLLFSGNYNIKHTLPQYLPDGFLAKPFEAVRLVQEINSILNKYPKVSA